MSDRLELELRDVIVALKDVAGTQWYDLGLQLRLSPSILDTIAADHQTADDCKRMMLRKWLQSDPEASWERLAAALTRTGHTTAAAVIRSQFSLVITPKDELNTTEDEKIRLILTRKNLNKIKGQFSSLLLKVKSALKSHQVSVDDVHDFFVHYFSRDDWIHDPPNVDALFRAVSSTKLWNYDHYDPLEEITKQFLDSDADVKKSVSEYKSQLTGFYTTTRIADFIKLADFEESEQDPQQPLLTDSFTLKDYRKLKIKLKLDRKVSAVTLSYVDELWRSLAEEFDLPSLTAVIHSIIEGSLVVTWLVLPHIAEIIIANASKATKFFRRLGIVELAINECIIYDAEQMVTFERELSTICEGFPHVEPNTASRISHLLGYGVDPNISNDDGYTPLFRASMYGLVDLMRIFLQYGADVNQYSNMGWLPLYVTTEKKATAAVKLLLEYGADVNLPIKEGVSPLYVASENGHLQIVQLLIEYGALVNQANTSEQGDTALTVACYHGHCDIARLLLDHGAIIDYKNREGRSALFFACCNDQAETVRLLLEYGANADASSLYIASKVGSTEIVKLLVDYGVQVNDPYELEVGIQTTALHIACLNGHSQIAKLLIESGAMINAQTEEGYAPLHFACTNRHSQVIDILLSAGAIPDIVQNDGFTSLMLAANERDSADTVAALLAAKADPNIKYGENDRTALWYAASVGNVSVVEILLENGAIMDDRDKTGLTAYDIASINSHPDVCYLLEQYGYQPHHSSLSGASGSGRGSVLPSPPQQPRPQHRHDEITSLKTFRAILEHGSSQSHDDASLKHQTSHMSEENEEENL